jgi:hypothetical protein
MILMRERVTHTHKAFGSVGAGRIAQWQAEFHLPRSASLPRMGWCGLSFSFNPRRFTFPKRHPGSAENATVAGKGKRHAEAGMM